MIFPIKNQLGLCNLPDFATIEHIIELSRGGSNELDNLALAHRRCNLARGK